MCIPRDQLIGPREGPYCLAACTGMNSKSYPPHPQELFAILAGFDFTGTAGDAMTADLVTLSQKRDQKSAEDKESIVAGLKKLLEAAEKGEIKGLCYATVNTNDMLSFGILHTSACSVAELVGVSQLLNFRLIQASGV